MMSTNEVQMVDTHTHTLAMFFLQGAKYSISPNTQITNDTNKA